MPSSPLQGEFGTAAFPSSPLLPPAGLTLVFNLQQSTGSKQRLAPPAETSDDAEKSGIKNRHKPISDRHYSSASSASVKTERREAGIIIAYHS